MESPPRDRRVIALAAQVQEKIIQMYNRNSNAKEYLLRFAKSKDVWSVSKILLNAPKLPDSARAQVRFWASNMLYAKIRTEWRGLEPSFQKKVFGFLWTTAISTQCETKAHNGATNGTIVVLKRLCLALSVAAVLSNASYVGKTVAECLGLLEGVTTGTAPPSSGHAALYILESIPAELKNQAIPSKTQRVMTEGLKKFHSRTAKVLAALLRHRGTLVQHRNIFLACVREWVPLGLDLGFLCSPTGQPHPLLKATLGSLFPEDKNVDPTKEFSRLYTMQLSVATDTLCELLMHASAAKHTTGLKVVCRALMMSKATYSRARKLSASNVCRELTRAVTTMVECHSDRVSADRDFFGLTNYLMGCTTHPNRAIAAMALDGWLAMQDVPLARRHADLRHKTLLELTDVILKQCHLPSDCNEKDYHTADGDDFSFRTGPPGCQDIVTAVFDVVSGDMLLRVARLLLPRTDTPVPWRLAEAVLFFLDLSSRNVTSFVSNALVQPRGPSPSRRSGGVVDLTLDDSDDDTGASAGGAVVDEAAAKRRKSCGAITFVITEVFKAIRTRPKRFGSHPCLVATTSTFIGTYCGLIDKLASSGKFVSQAAATQMLKGSLQFLLRAIAVPTAARYAAVALKKMCRSCVTLLGSVQGVRHLCKAAHHAYRARHVPAEPQAEVAAGLSTLISKLPVESDFPTVIKECLGPHLRASMDPARTEQAVVGDLQVISSGLKFLQFRRLRRKHPLLPCLGGPRGWWQLLMRLAQKWRGSSSVMQSFCDLCRRLLESLGPVCAGPYLQSILQVVCTTFEGHFLPECLSTVAAALELFGSAETADKFRPFLAHIYKSVFKRARARVEPSKGFVFGDRVDIAHPETTKSFFELQHRALLFCPLAVLADKMLRATVALAATVLSSHDAVPLMGALRFLDLLLNPRGDAGKGAKALEAVLSACKPCAMKIVQAVFTLVTSTAKTTMYASLGAILWGLTTRFPKQLPGVMHSILKPVNALSAFGDKEKQLFVRSAMHLVAQGHRQKRRFGMLVSDLCKILRSMEDVDVLGGYCI